MSEKKGANILQVLLKEADAYTNMEQIEKFVQEGKSLDHLPIQPLFLTFKSLPAERASQYLEALSVEQRQAFLDLDLWDRDELDIENFHFWVKSYSHCGSEKIRQEFIKSDEFCLFLKAKFNIWTFDVEDPQYPDHDNYFLTDDNLLLFEFEEDYEYVDEVRSYIRELYSEMGVENAYSHLFKLVSDSYMSLQEEEYQAKKDRLLQIGFVDYYEALKIDNCFPNLDLLHNHILKKGRNTGAIDDLGKKQALHHSALIAYKDKVGQFDEELGKVEDEKRRNFLQFNFMRLVNGSISLNNALKDGPMAMTRIGQRTLSLLTLGFHYIKEFVEGHDDIQFNESESLFDRFEFVDIYQVGHTLIKLKQKELKKSVEKSTVPEDKDHFFGRYWVEYLDNAFSDFPKFSSFEELGKAIEIRDKQTYEKWANLGDTFIEFSPFIGSFYQAFSKLVDSGKLQDEFYLNYSVAEIDLETILISSFANFLLNNMQPLETQKMGLTLDEFRKFVSMIMDDEGKVSKLSSIEKFQNSFGLHEVKDLEKYLKAILKEHLEGYDYKNLDSSEFKHVGGPIILNLKIH